MSPIARCRCITHVRGFLRLYCEVELCLAASTFGRGGILSENRKGGQVTVHSAKNTTKFDAIVGRSANHADQINLGVAAALRSNIYGGVQRATSLTTTVSGGPDADDCAYVEFKVDGSPSAVSVLQPVESLACSLGNIESSCCRDS